MGSSATTTPIGAPVPTGFVAGPRARAPEVRPAFEIPSLNGIRAISFLIVLVAHLGLESIIPGGFGVTVFFFLSGYLITTLLRMEAEERGGISLRDFYLRRAFRIFPPFYAVLAASAIGTLLVGQKVNWPITGLQALHLTNYLIVRGIDAGKPVGSGVVWSLAVEEHFYLVFPLLYILLRRVFPGAPRKQVVALIGICAAVLAWRMVLVYLMGVGEIHTYYATDTRIDSILFGCALAIAGNPALDPVGSRERLWRTFLLPLGVFGLIVAFVVRDQGFRETVRYTLQGVALIPVFVGAIRYPESRAFRWLNLPILKQIALLSYSGYLIHFAAIQLLDRPELGPNWVRRTIAVTVTFAASAAMYRWVERPFGRLRKRLSRI